jgi:hypothetical protein
MYTLFNDLHPNNGTVVIPRFRVLKETFEDVLERAILYYQETTFRLNSNHFLIKLLTNLNVPKSLPTRVFIDKVADIALPLAQVLQITSPLSRGKVLTPGVFYDRNVTELLVANIDPFDLVDFKANWREYAPIRVLRHPKTDLDLYLFNNTVTTNEAGLAVISINIPMLAAQYQLWCKYEAEIGEDLEGVYLAKFLCKYPLPNMLYSHLDLAIFNRLCSLFYGVRPSDERVHTPFWQQDLTSRMDDVLVSQLKIYAQQNKDFDAIVDETSLVSYDNLRELFALPPTLYNRQNTWAYVISSLPLIQLLVQLNARYNNQRNGVYLNKIRRYFIQAYNDKSLVSSLPFELQMEINIDVGQGILPYLPHI